MILRFSQNVVQQSKSEIASPCSSTCGVGNDEDEDLCHSEERYRRSNLLYHFKFNFA